MKTSKYNEGWLVSAPGDEYMTLFRPGGIFSQIENNREIRVCLHPKKGARIFIPLSLEKQLLEATPNHLADVALIRSVADAATPQLVSSS